MCFLKQKNIDKNIRIGMMFAVTNTNAFDLWAIEQGAADEPFD